MALLSASISVGCSDDGGTTSSDAGASPRDAADSAVADAREDTAGTGDAAADADAATALVDHELWEAVSPGDDPFEDRPDAVDCDPEAYGTELIAPEETFFVKTQGCDYVTVSQPLAAAIPQGASVQVRLWHYDLTAPAASEAHLALMTGGHTIWQSYIPIPSDGELVMDTWTAPQAIAAGQEIFFHVHNHGNNEYNLIEVSLAP